MYDMHVTSCTKCYSQWRDKIIKADSRQDNTDRDDAYVPLPPGVDEPELCDHGPGAPGAGG
jgi:hypothetical protein